MSSSVDSRLDQLFDADRTLRRVEAELMENSDERELENALAQAVDQAAALNDRAEATLRLERLADLCAQIPGPRMADALVQILNDEEPSVRVAAGEALLDVGYERYAEVARAIERALDAPKRGPAMSELPWILAEIGEPSAVPLVRRFTEHPDADAVAAAVEALAQLGDPSAMPTLERLKRDERTVRLEDDLDQETTVSTIGELAQAAIEELSAQDDGER
jgi:HEAT repeat protein